MAVRTSMLALIARVRTLINDPQSASQIFDDQTIQDVCDESRVDVVNGVLKPDISYGPTIQYLIYRSELKNWESDYVIKQSLSTTVTPASAELIVGEFVFSSSTYPPLTITGKSHDLYRAAADLLERWAAKWTLSFDMNVDGQTLHRSQAADALQKLARTYRAKQRPGVISMKRSDLSSGSFRATDPTFGDRTGLGGGS